MDNLTAMDSNLSQTDLLKGVNMNLRMFFVVTMVLLFAVSSQAQEKVFQLALVNPIQLVPETESITGLAINLIYGKNVGVTGMNYGFINHTTGDSKGAQGGFINFCEGSIVGGQGGMVNIVKGELTGFQGGGINMVENGKGFQYGLVNIANNYKGLQLGLICIIKSKATLPVFVIFNYN
jgi:hypothetical protein